MRKPASYDVDHEKQDVVNKGAWSKQEDQKLIDYIHTHGEGCWRTLPQTAGFHFIFWLISFRFMNSYCEK